MLIPMLIIQDPNIDRAGQGSGMPQKARDNKELPNFNIDSLPKVMGVRLIHLRDRVLTKDIQPKHTFEWHFKKTRLL
jgi:hypothetical protein